MNELTSWIGVILLLPSTSLDYSMSTVHTELHPNNANFQKQFDVNSTYFAALSNASDAVSGVPFSMYILLHLSISLAVSLKSPMSLAINAACSNDLQ